MIVQDARPRPGDPAKAVLTKGQMPNSKIVPIILAKQFPPLLHRQTGIMFRLALPVMRLENPQQPLHFMVQQLRLLSFLVLNLLQVMSADPKFVHRALPTRLTPPFEILVNALAFRGPKPQETHHLSLTQPIQMVKQGYEAIPQKLVHIWLHWVTAPSLCSMSWDFYIL